MMASCASARKPLILPARSFCAALNCLPLANCIFCSAVVRSFVVFVLVVARSRAESCGEICGGAGLGVVDSEPSVCAGRGRGGAGRFAGTSGGAGNAASGGGSSTVFAGGGVSGGGIGWVISGGGVLTEGGAALTICLLAHPAADKVMVHNSAKNTGFRIMGSALRPRLDREDERPLPPTVGRAATRFETWCRVPLLNQNRSNHCAIARCEKCWPVRSRFPWAEL